MICCEDLVWFRSLLVEGGYSGRGLHCRESPRTWRRRVGRDLTRAGPQPRGAEGLGFHQPARSRTGARSHCPRALRAGAAQAGMSLLR